MLKYNLKIIVTILLCAINASVFAQSQNYTPSDCKTFSGTTKIDNWGAIYNSSGLIPATIICGIPHDYYSDGSIDKGWVHVIDQHPSQNVSCRFRGQSVNYNGTFTRYYSAVKSSTGYSSFRQWLSLDGVQANSISNNFLVCSIPPKSSVGDSRVYVFQAYH